MEEKNPYEYELEETIDPRIVDRLFYGTITICIFFMLFPVIPVLAQTKVRERVKEHVEEIATNFPYSDYIHRTDFRDKVKKTIITPVKIVDTIIINETKVRPNSLISHENIVKHSYLIFSKKENIKKEIIKYIPKDQNNFLIFNNNFIQRSVKIGSEIIKIFLGLKVLLKSKNITEFKSPVKNILKLRGGGVFGFAPKLIQSIFLGKGAEIIKKSVNKFLEDEKEEVKVQPSTKVLDKVQVQVLQGLGITTLASIILTTLTGRKHKFRDLVFKKTNQAIDVVFPPKQKNIIEKIDDLIGTITKSLFDFRKPYIYLLSLFLFVCCLKFVKAGGGTSELNYIASLYNSLVEKLLLNISILAQRATDNAQQYQELHQEQCKMDRDALNVQNQEIKDQASFQSKLEQHTFITQEKLSQCSDALKQSYEYSEQYYDRLAQAVNDNQDSILPALSGDDQLKLKALIFSKPHFDKSIIEKLIPIDLPIFVDTTKKKLWW